MKNYMSTQREISEKDKAENLNEKLLQDNITLGDDSLLKMTHLFKPYSPYTFLKQTYCQALHANKTFTLEDTEKQNKDSKGPEDAVKLYMCLKKHGWIVHQYTCCASSLKKGRNKLSLGILKQMYGPDKKWNELKQEMK